MRESTIQVAHCSTYVVEQDSSSAVTCHASYRPRRGGATELTAAGLANGAVALFTSRGEPSCAETKPRMLRGHSGIVCGLLFVSGPEVGGHGGYLLLSCSADRTVRVWDPASSEPEPACVQTLRGHGGTVTDLATTDTGMLVTGSTDSTVRIWRADPARTVMLHPWFSEVQVLRDVGGWINALALHSKEETLYVGDEQGHISVYRPAGGAMRLSRWRQQQRVHSLGVTRLLLVPGERVLVSASYDCTAKVLDTRSGAVTRIIDSPHRSRFTALCWDGARSELLLGDESGHLSIWDVGGEGCLKCERLWGDGALPKQGGEKVAAALANAVRVSRIDSTGPRVGKPGPSQGGLRHLALAEGGRLLSSSGTAVDAWRVVHGISSVRAAAHSAAVVAVAGPGTAAVCDEGEERRSDAARSPEAALSTRSSESAVYSASLDGTIRAWDPQDMSCTSIFHEVRSEIACLIHCPRCERLVTGHDDGAIRLWHVDSGSTVTLSGHSNTVTCLSVDTRGKSVRLLSSSFDGTVGAWDISGQRPPRLELLFAAHEEEVLAVRAAELTPRYVTAGSGALIKIWSLDTHALLGQLRGHTEPVGHLAVDGHFLLSGSDDGSVRLWDLYAYALLRVLPRAQEGPLRGLLVVPDSGWLVACSEAAVRVWDYDSGGLLKEWRHAEPFCSIGLRRSTGDVIAGTEEGLLVALPLAEVTPSMGA